MTNTQPRGHSPGGKDTLDGRVRCLVGLKWLAAASAAKKTETFQVIGPVEIVSPLVVVSEFNGIDLPEMNSCPTIVKSVDLESK